LSDADIVGLVNLRFLAETLRRAPVDVLAERSRGSWVEVCARLIGGGRPD
ncbi:MAG: hypothetical protein FJ098_16625, partial [Deltaproteobacteria bacterium]|nr:hypothetical protein [Deltaproteobacteria bacterium]